MKNEIVRLTAALLTVAAFVAGGAFLLGRTTKQLPVAKPLFPTYVQVTQAGTVLVHDFDMRYIALSSAPDFMFCDHKRAKLKYIGGVTRCVFLVNLTAEKSDYWAVFLDRSDHPVWAEKLKRLPTPEAA